MFKNKFKLNCWKVTVIIGSTEKIVYFANKELAELAVEWAYQVRFKELKMMPASLCYELQEYSPSNSLNRKLSWWTPCNGKSGFICNKEYFYAKEFDIEIDIIG